MTRFLGAVLVAVLVLVPGGPARAADDVDVKATLADHRAGPPGHAGTPHEPRREPNEAERQDDSEEHEEKPLAIVLHQLVLPEVADHPTTLVATPGVEVSLSLAVAVH